MIKGKWFSYGSAAQTNALLDVIDGTHFSIKTEEGVILCTAELSSLAVSDRLGKVERKITLKDGSVFSTHDNDAVDRLIKNTKGGTGASGFLNALESHMGWVGVALVVTALSTFVFFKWGVPWTSKVIARSLPHEVNQVIASNTFEFLDEYIFDKSELDGERQAQIRAHFNTNIAPLSLKEDEKVKYTLHFRSWADMPNAFALPSGDIILTDKFVELSENQDEIDSVLLHEMGHIVNRHSLQMIIQSTFVTVFVMMVTGDSSGFADLGIGLGSLIVSTNYARDHESEADTYAFKHMMVARIDPKAFASIMARMTEYIDGLENKNSKSTKKDKEDSIFDYISTHPNTLKRIEIAKKYSDCFKQGLIECKVEISK